ncbi:hypothetical protein FHS57_004664 [Runella defluvii]|uniref:Uncharacterized protein n=1 Tax=Runella defluvii TaxID=370973 RepID=A0A7W6ESE9_9BACT|nr:hypothetical protein [Runella defluvii]
MRQMLSFSEAVFRQFCLGEAQRLLSQMRQMLSFSEAVFRQLCLGEAQRLLLPMLSFSEAVFDNSASERHNVCCDKC